MYVVRSLKFCSDLLQLYTVIANFGDMAPSTLRSISLLGLLLYEITQSGEHQEDAKVTLMEHTDWSLE